ncbi:hypothetical protein PS1M3_08910 [Pseudoalteromonas sp. PS1M3]|nr:hypothetical protein PS1M3_08910 [Pseudoalteromonas sp. PS1M3]
MLFRIQTNLTKNLSEIETDTKKPRSTGLFEYFNDYSALSSTFVSSFLDDSVVDWLSSLTDSFTESVCGAFGS